MPYDNSPYRARSGGAMVLGNLPVLGHPTILITVGQGPIALAVGAGGGGLDIFTLIYPFSSLSPSLWETARYRLKYCLKGPSNQKQPTNQLSLYCCCCCIVVLRPRYTSKVMSGRSVNLTTLFLDKLRPPKRLTSTSCTYFHQ